MLTKLIYLTGISFLTGKGITSVESSSGRSGAPKS